MPTDWTYVLRLFAPVLQWLPKWILKQRFPIRKCQDLVEIIISGVGPHIFVNQERSPAIAGPTIVFFNRLPFPVTIDGVHLEFLIDSKGLTNSDQIIRNQIIPICGITTINLNEIHLTNSQAEIVRQYSSQYGECPILKITGHVSCKAVIGDFDKNLGLETRAFIYCEDGKR